MRPRDTATGSILENMIIPPLEGAGFAVARQAVVGTRPNGGKQVVDVVASAPDGRSILVSLKWQQVSGTAEQKVPYEVICLMEAIQSSEGAFSRAYLVLGGEGWTLRNYYTSGRLCRHINYSELVEILTLESFVARANRGQI